MPQAPHSQALPLRPVAATPSGELPCIQGSAVNNQPMGSRGDIQCVGFKQGTNMADMNIVLEGSLKHREGKKWKPRWCVVRKLSPVADRLHISLYKDAADCYRSSPEKAMLPLEEFLGIESCFTLDREANVMAIVCLNDVTLLAFQGRETLIQWEIRIRSHLGEENQYPAKLLKTPPNNRLALGLVKLYIQGGRIGLTTGTPPAVIGSWNIADLRKYGVVEKKFCFEAGSRCGRVAGLYVLLTEQGQEISDRVSQASQAKHTKPRRSSSSSSAKRRSQLSCHSVMSNMSSISGLSGLSGFSSPPPEVFAKDFRDTEVYADLNFMSEPSPLTGSSVETTSTIFSDSSSDSEKHKLVSIESLLTPDRTGFYDTLPHGLRSVDLPGAGMASNNLNNDLTLRQNELEDTNTLPRIGSRDELNISPELDDVDGCGMILDSESVRLTRAEMAQAQSHNIKTRLGSTNSSHSYTSGGSTSSVSLSAGFSSESSASASSQPHLSLVTSSSSNDMDAFLSTVQRNVDVLSPKLPKCDQSKVLTTISGDSNGGEANGCVFESHGQVREPDMESLDLLDEVLRACNVDAFSSSSGGHSSHGSKGDLGVHSIHSSTCSIGSANHTGEGLSEGSAQTSPAQAGSVRTSPARSSPIHTGHSPTQQTQMPSTSGYVAEGPLSLMHSAQVHSVPVQPPQSLASNSHYGIQISSNKCRNHDYVNVSGIGSMLAYDNMIQQQLNPQQQQQQQQQQPSLSSFSAVPSSVGRHSSIQVQGNGRAQAHQVNNTDFHDYVNISAMNGMNGNSAPVRQYSHLTPSMQQHQLLGPTNATTVRPDANSNPSVPLMLADRAVIIDPNRPLPFVDLGCYDNEEEGYLYWVKGSVDTQDAPVILAQPGSKAAANEPGSGHTQAATAGSSGQEGGSLYKRVNNKSQPNLNQYEHDHQDYVNTPVSGARSVMAKLSAVRGKLLAYHDSLRRSKKPQIRRNTVEDSGVRRSSSAKSSPRSSPKHSPKGSPKRSPRSSPKSDRNSLRTALFRSRGKSLEDILDATVGEQGVVPPPEASGPRRGARLCCSPSRIDGEYVQLNLDESCEKSVIRGYDRRVVPELSRTPAAEDTAYIMMTGEGSRTMLSSTSSHYSHSDMESPGSLQSGYDYHYAAGATSGAGTGNPFSQSPSPIRSPRSLRRTPPSVGAMSPHTSPKKVRAQSTDHGNYMFMSGQLREEEDCAVFCAMELPLRSGSVSSHHSTSASMRSRNCSFSSTASSDTHTAEDNMSYLSMSMGRQRSNSSQAFRSVNRPPLNQSRSLDTDYDSEYLPMSMVPGGAARGNHHSDYMCMTPGGDEGASGGRTPVRPFEDLIEHEPYVTRKPILPPQSARKNSDASTSGRSEDYVKSPPPGKRDRFLSRLIRRNSSKERRSSTQSKSQEDILRSPIAETLPEVPISEPNSPSPYTPINQDPFGLIPSPRTRRASVDVSKPPPLTQRVRSASYSYNRSGCSEAGNLTDEQKQMGAMSTSNSTASHSGSQSDSPPALPPRTYVRSREVTPSVLYPIRKKAIPPLPPPQLLPSHFDDTPPSSNSPDLEFLDRPVSPNMPTERPPPPPSAFSLGSDTTLCTDSNPNSTNTSTLTLLHISEDDDKLSTPPPELPEKTHRRRSSPGSVLSASFSLLRRQTARRCPSPTWHSQSELLLTEASSACASPTVAPRAHRGGHLVVHIPPNSEETEEVWASHSNGGSRVSTPTNRDDGRPSSRPRLKTDSSESQSLSSYGSADTTSTRSDEYKASPASTTMRPRFGKEYKKLDRRKLTDDISTTGGGGGYPCSYVDGQRTPGSPSVASSVFTFDTTSLSSRVSSLSGHSGYGNESPRSPSQHHAAGPPRSPAYAAILPGAGAGAIFPLGAVPPPHRMPHDYINVCMPRNDSPRFWDMTPPGSPRSLSGASEQSNPMLNYAEIDLTLAEERKPRKPLQKNDIEYAMIDMVATAAASRAGKEHAQLREDSLRRKDGRRGGEDGSQEYIRRSKIERKNSAVSSSGSRSEKKPASRSGSKDRKVSAPN